MNKYGARLDRLLAAIRNDGKPLVISQRQGETDEQFRARADAIPFEGLKVRVRSFWELESAGYAKSV